MIIFDLDTARVPRSLRPLACLAALSGALAVLCMSPAPAQAADAEALIKEGKALLADKKIDEACQKFEEAQKASPGPAALIELGLCHEKQGKLATAWAELVDAEADARKIGRADLESRARGNNRALEPKLPRVTINAAKTPGLEIAIDGQKVDPGALGKGRPVDPGEHKITASAPGYKPWETSVSLKTAERKSVSVPALEAGAGPVDTGKPPTPEAGAGSSGTQDKPGPTAGSNTGKQTQPEAPPAPYTGPLHRSKRIVVDVGVFGGAQLGLIHAGFIGALGNVNYEYRVKDSNGQDAVLLEGCNSSKCVALFDPSFGVPVGGQVFVGYAVKDTLQVGGRFFGSYLVTGGYMLLVGPSLSARINPRVWLGGTLVVGFGAQKSPVIGGKGDVPAQWVALNGSDEAPVTLDSSVPKETNAPTGFTVGLAGEVSIHLADFGDGQKLSTGSLVASAWPTFLKTWHGGAFALPIGIGYRFH
jgi:hypothetical protein